MRPSRALRLALAALGMLATALAHVSAAQAGGVTTDATPISATQIQVHWHWWENPGYPTGHPEWVGYDLYRTASGPGGCAPQERLNPEILARVPGGDQDVSFLDTTPVPGTPYLYSVHLVDANRQPVYFTYPACESPCSPPAWAMCPDLFAPLTEGTVTDWGWAVLISGCAGGCYGSFYISNPAANALRPYAGTGQPVRVWGDGGCGAVEGCGMSLDHWELGGCVVTPTRRTSWGALKSHYR